MSEDLSSPLDFDSLVAIEVSVKYQGRNYVLREASGDAAIKYRNALLKSMKIDEHGKPLPGDGIADVDPLLVSMCLYRADSGGKILLGPDGLPDPRQLVPVHTIRAWPNRMQEQLAKRVKQISGMTGTDEVTENGKEKTATDLMPDGTDLPAPASVGPDPNYNSNAGLSYGDRVKN